MSDQWWLEVDFIPKQDQVLEKGCKGDAVKEVQRLLRKLGYKMFVDGDYGGATERTVRRFQRDIGLIPDGRVGPKTLWRLRCLPADPKVLTQKDIEAVAERLGVQVPAVMAVNEVESRGSGFFDNGKAAILYERHVMRRQLKDHNVNPAPYIEAMPGIVNTKTGGYKGGVHEYERLEVAQGIHADAALESCSWGAFQIMGYHWARLGYRSVREFVEKMQTSEGEHIRAFAAFVEADLKLHTALMAEDWTTFARRYNGPAYAKNQYDIKLLRAFEKHQQALAYDALPYQ